MSPSDTIAAVASGWTPAHWGLVRISGPEAGRAMQMLGVGWPDRPQRVARGGFKLSERHVIPAWLLRFDAPRSYTGEDVAELLVPGNPLVLERVMRRLLEHPGVREAQPGEFSARAYLNGKLTLEQAEGIAATISAQTEEQLRAAEELRSGMAGARYRAMSDELATLLALVESGIDFSDQDDVVPIAPAELAKRLNALALALRGVIGHEQGREQAMHRPRVALVGPPNAGKSTLFNALLGRRRAVASPIAGTTRDVLVEPLDLGRDLPVGSGEALVDLMDLPGLDAVPENAGPSDLAAQIQAREAVGRADVLILCRAGDSVSGSAPHFPAHLHLPQRHEATADVTTIRVRTKADQPAARGDVDESDVAVCALDGWNLDVLRRAIADAAMKSSGSAGGPWLLPRHRRGLRLALERVEAGRALIDVQSRSLSSPEMIAGELRGALDVLGELVGAVTPDDIIGRIFATFCIGK